MAALPIFQTSNKDMGLLQTNWAAALNPILANAANNGILLKSVPLLNGTTQVNHKLGRKLQGWTIVRQRAAASVHDAQDGNQMPELTLTLISNAAVVVDLYVF